MALNLQISGQIRPLIRHLLSHSPRDVKLSRTRDVKFLDKFTLIDDKLALRRGDLNPDAEQTEQK